MTDLQKLEIELEAIDMVLDFLGEQMDEYEGKRRQLTMKLNRARRLEREELQK